MTILQRYVKTSMWPCPMDDDVDGFLLTIEHKSTKSVAYNPEGVELLEFLKKDLHEDISGMIPLSGINYIWILARCHMIFLQIEERLKILHNPSWIAAYESTDRDPRSREKRVALTVFSKHISCR